MYATNHVTPAAMPATASFVRPAARHYVPRPYTPRRYGKLRSLRAACIANGYSMALTQACLNTAWRRLCAGKPVVWPS
jgi:hypothetical protein